MQKHWLNLRKKDSKRKGRRWKNGGRLCLMLQTSKATISNPSKRIVREKSRNMLGEQSRLWFYQDILHILQQDMGTNKVEAMVLDLPENEEVQWSGEEFLGMKNLKMLVIRNASFSKCPKYLPNSLRWLEWKGCPFKFLPYQVRPTQLVYLDLSNSSLELLHPFDKVFHNLSHMNLINCKQLQQIPDLSGAFNLRKVCLDGCIDLIEIHDSVGCLKQLRELSAMRCKNLKILPSCLKSTFLKHINLFGCSSLKRFPEISVRMEEIQTLDIDKTAITELPPSICNLIGLEILSMEECPNLKQLPASICTLPNLWKLTANFCEGIRYFKICEGGDKASLDCSAMSLKMEQLCFSNCNLSYDSLSFCLPHFTNVIHLDLSFNNFTVLPQCIKEYHNLKYFLLDNCNQLQHIGGIPPNLEKFSAMYCTSLTDLSKRKVLKQAFNFQPGKRNFIFPGRKLPERLHNYSHGSFVSFWIRDVFPAIFLWILVKDYQDYVYNFKFSVHINDTKLDISSEWLLLSTIKADHIFICDIQSIIHTSELPLQNKWKQVKISLESKKLQEIIKGEKGIYFGVHVYNRQSNLENIQFGDPKRYRDHNLLQEIQEEQDWEEFDEDMKLDSNSKTSAESIENSKHYQGGSSSLVYGVTNGLSGFEKVLPCSKYLVVLELLDELVKVNDRIKSKIAEKSSSQTKVIEEPSMAASLRTYKPMSSSELSAVEKQDIQMKKAKLINMLDEVEARYKHYHRQLQIMNSLFEQDAGIGSARTYTAQAQVAMSRHFRSLKDAIMGQIRAANNSLGEEDFFSSKMEGSRLKHVSQRGLPERFVSVLRAWLFEHFLHPYPSESDEHMLAKQTGLTKSQVSDWFINARIQLWEPLVEEMFLEEMKENE